jgi:hypothetical protein
VINLALYLGIIYYTADLGGDFTIYRKLFQDIGNQTLAEFLLYQRKEIIYSMYSFIMYKLTFGSFNLYVGLTISVIYLLNGMGLIKYSIERNNSLASPALIILMLMLFPPLFHLNGVIFRQNLALSVLFYAIAMFRNNSYKLILMVTVAVFIHYSSALILGIYIITNNLTNLRRIFPLLLGIMVVYFYGLDLINWLASYNESIKYLSLRIVRSDIYDNVDNSSLANMVVPKITFIVQLILALFNVYKKPSFFSKMFLVYSVVFGFILLGIDYRVLEYRIFLMNYFFIGFVILDSLSTINFDITKSSLKFSFILFPLTLAFFFFYISVRELKNDYLDFWQLMISPLFLN